MVRVDFPEPVIELGLNEKLVRDGTPLTLSETLPENPFSADMETVYVPEDLRATLKLEGVAVRVKSGAAPTTKLTDAVCTRFPLVAAIVNGYVPNGVDDVVLTVNVEDPEPVTEVGLKPAVAPVGRPLIVKPIWLLNPLVEVTFTV
jgi:hypothetical protein